MPLKAPVPAGFSISFRRGRRWVWEQKVKAESKDDVTERDGFKSWRAARADLDAELARRRRRASAPVEAEL